MKKLKQYLKKNRHFMNIYICLKKINDKRKKRQRLKYTGKFINRSKGYDSLCIILAGYKEFAYPAVFGRIEKYAKKDMDICVVSSGIYSEKLEQICEKNKWSYLSTKDNNVCLIQNVAISKFPNARYIFKLDEDVFVTEGYFDNLLRAYHHAKEGKFIPGVMAPMLNVNGFAYGLILEKLNLVEKHEEQFGKFKYGAGPDKGIESNAEIAKFMWGNEKFVPSIDEMNEQFSKENLREIPCPLRFSIGAILFERDLWDDMGYFKVNRSTNGMGKDEVELDSFCCLNSRVLMVSENVVVGHLSFGKQNEIMKQYFMDNMQLFLPQEK